MWEFFCNHEGQVWCAYNIDASTMHVLCDEVRDGWDPDPTIPQFVIDAWRTAKDAGYRSGITNPGCGAAYIAK